MEEQTLEEQKEGPTEEEHMEQSPMKEDVEELKMESKEDQTMDKLTDGAPIQIDMIGSTTEDYKSGSTIQECDAAMDNWGDISTHNDTLQTLNQAKVLSIIILLFIDLIDLLYIEINKAHLPTCA